MDYSKGGDKELPRVGHQLASCSLLNSYVLLMFLSEKKKKLSLAIEVVQTVTDERERTEKEIEEIYRLRKYVEGRLRPFKVKLSS